MKIVNVSGAALAAAAASLFIAGAATAQDAQSMKAMGFGHCMKANSCKGLSACKGGKPGLNACKGQGFSLTAEAPCKKAGHKFENM